jgi:peptidyl-prolyl cis-trans isomerase SurA
MMSAPEEPADLGGQLVNDYQDWLEKQWLKRLKKQYRTKIYKKVLETVLNEG